MDEDSGRIGVNGGKRRVVLHVGFPKTGTTSIQNVFHTYREWLLRDQGLLYPSLQPNLTTPLCTIFQHDPHKHIANKVAGLTDSEIAQRRTEYLNALESEISKSDWSSLLLSAEGLSNLSAVEIQDLRDWGDGFATEWSVLICVRHPVDYTKSVIQQLMKGGEVLEDMYRKLPLPNYEGKISNVLKVFDISSVQVFDFERAIKRTGGLVAAFSQHVGLREGPAKFLASKAVSENESLSLEAVQILDALNHRRPMFVNNVRAPYRSGRELGYLSRIQGKRFELPSVIEDRIRSNSFNDIRWLNDTFDLSLYGDIVEQSDQASEFTMEQESSLSEPAAQSIADILGELVTEQTLRAILDRGRVAMSKGNYDLATRQFNEAARLVPNSNLPGHLLKRVADERAKHVS